MLLTLSLLPIYLLLVDGVTSADLSYNRKVPKIQTGFTRRYNSNHPPVIETYDKIPVTVLYDDEEAIKVSNKNEGKDDVIVGDEKKNSKHASNGRSINIEVPVNHPPARGLFPLPEVDDFKEELNSKPRSRSIKIPANENHSVQNEAEKGVAPRRRVKKVKRVKVNKTQLHTSVRESERNKNKEDQKEATRTTVPTRSEEPSTRAPQIFKPRTGIKDPVVPIIESESYVFSHSGNFHYSYEGGDGTKAYERGQLRSSNGSSGSAVEGNFSYKGEDGQDISLSYTADENGYRPVGAHLPTSPPIPIAIQRALAYLATKPTPEPTTERIRTLNKKNEK